MDTKFGKWLRDALKEKGVNQSRLADALGVTPAQISRIISGERGITLDMLTGIANYLGKPLQEVLVEAGITQSVPQAISFDELLKYKINRLKPDRRSVAIRIIDALIREQEEDERSR